MPVAHRVGTHGAALEIVNEDSSEVLRELRNEVCPQGSPPTRFRDGAKIVEQGASAVVLREAGHPGCLDCLCRVTRLA